MTAVNIAEAIEELVKLDNSLQVGTSSVLAILIDALCEKGVLDRAEMIDRLEDCAARLVAIDPDATKQMCADQVIDALNLLARQSASNST
ncbi:hypothetical protein CHELA1G11_10031 [Hyphomicrobiales bacterium]|nr:hypothetical protein CHELA1G11_10031 [Hyphomicrobiales bacterium]CAH1677559.1 hypothetical protein CHELA1G2_14279 [Hyphomicrobiales bacterium]